MRGEQPFFPERVNSNLAELFQRVHEVMQAGTRPVLSPWSGTLFHGTSAEKAREIVAPPGQIRMPDLDDAENWERLLVGPAVYGFCGEPCWGGEEVVRTPEEHGVTGALAFARYRVERGTLEEPLAVVAFEVKLARVLDLEGVANRDFCNPAAAAMVAQGQGWGWDTDDLGELRNSTTIGKVLNAGLDEVPEEWRPEACRLHLPPTPGHMQAAFAIFKESSMLHARFAG